MAYTSQQPWVFAGTLKENILFGRPYNKTKYESVLTVCALKRVSMKEDFELSYCIDSISSVRGKKSNQEEKLLLLCLILKQHFKLELFRKNF